ncbi:MAG: hypothetical protein IVW55_12210 [Chloroflexi bacterium]|nr:hypothetical protein [Chloroflexota bacterium]
MSNTKASLGWLLMFLTALLLMVSGIQGSFGRVLACAVTPGLLVVTEATPPGGGA